MNLIGVIIAHANDGGNPTYEGTMKIENEELQAPEADENLQDDNLEAESDGESSDSAPENQDEDSEENQEEQPAKVVFDDNQQAKVNELIGEKVKATRTVERENENLKTQLADAQSKIPVEARPAIPPMPESYDDNFEQKVKEHYEGAAKAEAFDGREAEAKRDQESQQQQQAQEQQKKNVSMIVDYADRAKKLGMTDEDIGATTAVITNLNMHPDLLRHIVEDENGPLINQYLATNPLAVDEMKGMTVAQAAVHVETVVKPAALSSKKISKAPKPSTNLGDGGGAPPNERGPKGATFE